MPEIIYTYIYIKNRGQNITSTCEKIQQDLVEHRSLHLTTKSKNQEEEEKGKGEKKPKQMLLHGARLVTKSKVRHNS